MSDLVEIFNPFFKSKITPINRNNASALYAWVEKEAARQGVPVPELHLVHHELPNAGGYFHKRDGGHIYITQGTLSHLHHSPNLNHHVPTGLKALLAHEMSHIKDMASGYDSVRIRKFTMFSMPVIALVGYEIYKHMKERMEEDPSKPLQAHLNDVMSELKTPHNLSMDPVLKYLQADINEWGKRLAVMTLGLTAGGFSARHISLSSEFRADRAAVAASGFKPETYIEELKKLMKISEKMIAPKVKQWANTFKDRSFKDNVSQIYQVILHDLSALTYHAHPGEAERFRAMRDFAKSAAPVPQSL